MLQGGSFGAGSSAYHSQRLSARSGSVFPVSFSLASTPVKQLAEGLGASAGVLKFRDRRREIKVSYFSVSNLFIECQRQEAQLSTVTPASGMAVERILLTPGQASYL